MSGAGDDDDTARGGNIADDALMATTIRRSLIVMTAEVGQFIWSCDT